MSTIPAPPRPLPVATAALEQEVARLLRKYAKSDQRALLIRAEPVWAGPEETVLHGRPVRIVAAVSPLAVIEQVTVHLERDDDAVLVVLTDAEESALGVGLLSRVIRQRVFVVEPWLLVEESFGAQQTDPRLLAESWAAEALIDAMPPGGWPRLAGAMLTRETALRQLAARRLRLERLGIGADELNAGALLVWSTDPAAVEAFGALRDGERSGLRRWLTEIAGSTPDVVFRLADGGRAEDALALGVLCGALWAPAAEQVAQRSQGGVLAYISALTSRQAGSPATVTDATIRAFASDAENTLTRLLREGASVGESRLAQAVLDRAEELVVQFGARPAARHSDLLPSGFEDRIDEVAATLKTAIRQRSPESLTDLAGAVAELRAHTLAPAQAHRVRRAEMARRLLQWLVRPFDAVALVSGVGTAVQAQVDEWGWVDRARDDVWVGEPHNETLKEAYEKLHDLVRDRGRDLNRAFAAKLAAWTATGPGDLLTVDAVLPRVVSPLVARGDDPEGLRPVLFVVLDGMSTAVAAELAEELRRQHWEEYDPLPDAGRPRRRAVVAAIPTVTRVSRASLFAARLTTGGAADERKAFENHPFWRGRTVRLFHKDSLAGDAGRSLGDELTAALEDASVHVGVVLNAIDDSLDKGRGRVDDVWAIADIGILRTLLHYARLQGRAVILTSDHGHVLERDGTLRADADAGSARHREAGRPPGEGEVELSGPRVAGGRLVALWDPSLRYLPSKAGYHGGASLAEVTIPLLAFLPLGSSVPEGWRALPDQRPEWWSLDARPPVADEPSPAPARSRARGKKPVEAVPPPTLFDGETAPALFDAAPPAPAVTNPNEVLVTDLLASELFAAQHQMMPRKIAKPKIQSVLLALLDAGGPLPLPVVADSAGEHAVRAAGFVATLQRMLNVDNYPVLSITDNGRSVRLDPHLLREQFGLRPAPRRPGPGAGSAGARPSGSDRADKTQGQGR
ncbi:BREX-2 system phosphatase PglZ [Sphaerisporangium rhizosphaerae]|uniref:BREX-2 system phosphatase PglZ n=1 Tax=Sphaerisporangium rhizosphaerae TaxID=2269375 RepID=A0ABW2P4C1_9ACTN